MLSGWVICLHQKCRNIPVSQIQQFWRILGIKFRLVIISFIQTINRTTQIHQPITFDYFDHQPITEKMDGECGYRVKTIKTIFVAEKSNFCCNKVFSGERFRIKGLFYNSCNMAISVQTPCWRWTIAFKWRHLKTKMRVWHPDTATVLNPMF